MEALLLYEIKFSRAVRSYSARCIFKDSTLWFTIPGLVAKYYPAL